MVINMWLVALIAKLEHVIVGHGVNFQSAFCFTKEEVVDEDED